MKQRWGQWARLGLRVSVLAAVPAQALECGLQAGATPLPAMTGCVHGLPVRQGELLLIPRVCRATLANQPVVRHSVDVRHAETGAKIGTASLPPTTPGTGEPVPGTVLAGEPPLLVTPDGIAALEPRKGVAEPSFAPEGTLVAVARSGDVLVVVEATPADKHFPAGSLAITVMDQEAGDLLGEQRIAGTALSSLELRAGTGKALDVLLTRTEKDKLVTAVLPVRDAAGKKLANKDGVLGAKLQPGTPPPASVTGDGCAVVQARLTGHVGQTAVRVADGHVGVPNADARATWTGPAEGGQCMVVSALGTGETPAAAVWLQTAPDKAVLRVARCTRK